MQCNHGPPIAYISVQARELKHNIPSSNRDRLHRVIHGPEAARIKKAKTRNIRLAGGKPADL
jgi:hypothetical protein